MIRSLSGIAAGIAVAIVIMVLVEALANQLYPSSGLALERPGSAASLPVQSLIFPVVGWFLGPLVGGSLAVWASRHPWAAWPVGAAVLIGALLQFTLMGHPAWLMAAGIGAPLAGAWAAQLLAGRTRRSRSSG